MFDGEKLSYSVAQKYQNSEHVDVRRQRAWLEVDHEALGHNIRALKDLLVPQTELMAVVKADAYGHGVIPVATTVLKNGASWLAIATLAEGVELRKAGVSAPISLADGAWLVDTTDMAGNSRDLSAAGESVTFDNAAYSAFSAGTDLDAGVFGNGLGTKTQAVKDEN